jgi:hypothetical protein
MNIQLTAEAIHNLIVGLQIIENHHSTFVPPKTGEQPDYNAAMRTNTVQLINNDYKITISKYEVKPQQETLDLMDDE